MDVAAPPPGQSPSSFGDEEEWTIGTAWQYQSSSGAVLVSAPDRESPLYEGQLLLDHYHGAQPSSSSSSSSSPTSSLSQPFKAVHSSNASDGSSGGSDQVQTALVSSSSSWPGQSLRLLECCDEARLNPVSKVLFATALREGLLKVNWQVEWQLLDGGGGDDGGSGSSASGVVAGTGQWLSLRTNQLLCEAQHKNGETELVEVSTRGAPPPFYSSS